MAATARPKEFAFPLSVEWVGGRRVVALVDDKDEVAVAPPVVFRGTDPHAWSPEDLFVASAASCLAVTFTGLAERNDLQLASLHVSGEGVVGARDDAHFGFTALHLTMRAVVEPADVEAAQRLAEQAESDCLVSASMALPVNVAFDVRGGSD
jgi:organic hydroperoxide reductase OsmC/OhrA